MNGKGKTQFLKMLVDQKDNLVLDKEKKEMFRFNPQVNIGYFDQHMKNIPLKKTMSSYIQTFGYVC